MPAAFSLLVTAAGAIALAGLWRRQQRAGAGSRAAFFHDCRGALEGSQIVSHDREYPFLRGSHRGRRVRATAFSETLNVRKLPCLWLSLDIDAPLGFAETISIMARPSGAEFYSPFADLPYRVEAAGILPPHAIAKSNVPITVYKLGALASAAPLFDDPRVKELVLRKSGLRLIWRLDEAERGTYLLFRQSDFKVKRLERGVLETVLAQASNLLDALAPDVAGQRQRSG